MLFGGLPCLLAHKNDLSVFRWINLVKYFLKRIMVSKLWENYHIWIIYLFKSLLGKLRRNCINGLVSLVHAIKLNAALKWSHEVINEVKCIFKTWIYWLLNVIWVTLIMSFKKLQCIYRFEKKPSSAYRPRASHTSSYSTCIKEHTVEYTHSWHCLWTRLCYQSSTIPYTAVHSYAKLVVTTYTSQGSDRNAYYRKTSSYF